MRYLIKTSFYPFIAMVMGITFLSMSFWGILDPARAKQENNPIYGQVVPEQMSAKMGESVHFTVTLETVRCFSRMALVVTIPNGIRITEGEQNFEFKDFTPDEKRTFHFSFEVNSSEERRIFFTARAMGLSNEMVSQVFVAVINHSQSDPSFIETDKTGKSYRVYGIE